ncbi:MAG: MFS transporter [Hydrogenophaga sp.]|uniref:MFS transporter n=1 Tax=Hydrogenophaga sp. TaxID=1904254 RepID=UPI002716C954|nr:MFS transporter [Hydrogenophaga sp.]MDO9479523.1 MFS transporter [Hydrogenophaga sp.]MDO9571102.1 MFS transporter [Hydrogenophaga sp.]MDP3345002.1 MFS transporter [Hydrogenophaga sp.]MDP3805475.1 MFS transporter [Hydrogenophaga sp.]MDZ4239581.1 MFS transporter [Hydrogenophaga sp.]
MRASLSRLIAAQISLHACMTGFRMAAPLMALREGHSPVAVGMLLALFALAQVFLALPAGRYADRRGLKKPVVLAVGVATAGAALAVAFPIFAVLCVTALTCGAATGLAMIALQRHVGRLASNPTELKQVFSWMAIGPSISNFVGPFAAGLLIDAYGFRAAFLLLALLPSLAWFWVRGTVELEPVAPEHRNVSGSSWNLLRDAGFRRLMLINWMLSSCWDVHTFLVPVIGHERDLSATVIGAILGAFALAATAIRLAMPWLAAHLRESVVIGTAMVCTAGLFAVYPLVQAAWAMGALSVLLGLALGSVQPMIMSTLHQITPRHRHGEALGLRAMAINGSSVVMPLLFGSAGVVVGVAGVFWVVGVVVGLGSRLAWTLHVETAGPH